MKKMSEWDILRNNPPRNWRDEWEQRAKVWRADTMAQAERWIEKHSDDFLNELQIALHVKDGYVVYYNYNWVWEVKGFDCTGDLMTWHFEKEDEIDNMLANWGIEEFKRERVHRKSYMFLEDIEDEN